MLLSVHQTGQIYVENVCHPIPQEAKSTPGILLKHEPCKMNLPDDKYFKITMFRYKLVALHSTEYADFECNNIAINKTKSNTIFFTEQKPVTYVLGKFSKLEESLKIYIYYRLWWCMCKIICEIYNKIT